MFVKFSVTFNIHHFLTNTKAFDVRFVNYALVLLTKSIILVGWLFLELQTAGPIWKCVKTKFMMLMEDTTLAAGKCKCNLAQ